MRHLAAVAFWFCNVYKHFALYSLCFILSIFLFTQRDDNNDNDDDEEEDKEEEKKNQQVASGAEAVIEGQVYVNISPPLVNRTAVGGGASSGSRPRSRSYDRNLDKSPSPRLGSLERMLSCPMRLSEGAAPAPPPPPRVTSFAEIARSKRRNGGVGGSPSVKTAAADPFSSTYSTHSHSSVDFSPILERHVEADSQSLTPAPFTRCYSQGSIERHLEGGRETRAKAEGTPLLTLYILLMYWDCCSTPHVSHACMKNSSNTTDATTALTSI